MMVSMVFGACLLEQPGGVSPLFGLSVLAMGVLTNYSNGAHRSAAAHETSSTTDRFVASRAAYRQLHRQEDTSNGDKRSQTTTAPLPPHPPAPVCDLCSDRWMFVLSAGGRTGSTSLLEALNSVPGVHLSGENHAALAGATDLLQRHRASQAMAESILRRNGSVAAMEPANDVNEHGLLCWLQQWFRQLSGLAAQSEGGVVLGEYITNLRA